MPRLPITDCKENFYYGVVYNLPRKLPFFSIYRFTLKNIEAYSDRESEFTAYPCTESWIHRNQLTNANYQALNGFQRGHLSPHADLRYSDDVIKATFMFINAASQDAYTNKGPWKGLEARTRIFLRGDTRFRGGYVVLRDFAVLPVCILTLEWCNVSGLNIFAQSSVAFPRESG